MKKLYDSFNKRIQSHAISKWLVCIRSVFVLTACWFFPEFVSSLVNHFQHCHQRRDRTGNSSLCGRFLGNLSIFFYPIESPNLKSFTLKAFLTCQSTEFKIIFLKQVYFSKKNIQTWTYDHLRIALTQVWITSHFSFNDFFLKRGCQPNKNRFCRNLSTTHKQVSLKKLLPILRAVDRPEKKPSSTTHC